MGMLAIQIVSQLIGAALGALLGALLVQIGCRWVGDFKPGYGQAYKAAFLGYLAALVLGLVVGFMAGLAGLASRLDPMLGLVSGGLGILVQAGVYGRMLVGPRGRIGFGSGLLVALIQVVIGFLILLALIMATDFLVPGALDASSIA